MALWILSGTTQVSWYQKGKTKTNLDFLEQETVSSSGISWFSMMNVYYIVIIFHPISTVLQQSCTTTLMKVVVSDTKFTDIRNQDRTNQERSASTHKGLSYLNQTTHCPVRSSQKWLHAYLEANSRCIKQVPNYKAEKNATFTVFWSHCSCVSQYWPFCNICICWSNLKWANAAGNFHISCQNLHVIKFGLTGDYCRNFTKS